MWLNNNIFLLHLLHITYYMRKAHDTSVGIYVPMLYQMATHTHPWSHSEQCLRQCSPFGSSEFTRPSWLSLGTVLTVVVCRPRFIGKGEKGYDKMHSGHHIGQTQCALQFATANTHGSLTLSSLWNQVHETQCCFAASVRSNIEFCGPCGV